VGSAIPGAGSGLALAARAGGVAAPQNLVKKVQPTEWSEREATVQVRHKSDASGGCLPSLTLTLGVVARMRTQWPAYRVVGIASGLLTALGFIGLWACKQVREHQGVSESQFMQTSFGSIAVWSLSALFILGLCVLFPFSLGLQRRAGVPLPGPRLPSCVAWPAKVLGIAAVCVFGLIIIGLLLHLFQVW
jgi:hypothetical protein